MPRRLVRRSRSPARPGDWALVAVAKDEVTAEEWQRLLSGEGIEAQVRIDDPARAGMPGRTAFPLGYTEPGLSLFSYPLYVRRQQRREARQLLGEQVEFSRSGLSGQTVLGAVGVVVASLAIVILLVLRGS
ncbi:MAG TPA: hypothetical protein PLX85_04085 [Dehalococcoidia bacterium]|nr:hypothetical protein [Dehalococcoidia bacterium]